MAREKKLSPLSVAIVDYCAKQKWHAGSEWKDIWRSDHQSRSKVVAEFFEYPPATDEEIGTAEKEMGMALPVFLKTVLTEVANGHFGPGYGLYGVPTVATSQQLQMDMVREYRTKLSDGFWPEGMIPVCHWGCDIYTGYYTKDGQLIRVATDSKCFYVEKYQSEKWFQAWMQGKDLFNAVVNKAVELR